MQHGSILALAAITSEQGALATHHGTDGVALALVVGATVGWKRDYL